MSYISPELKKLVITRAGNCCEYCRVNQSWFNSSFHIEHIVAEKHEGKTIPENLCWSCPDCNFSKGSDTGSFDPQTGNYSFLYNPRNQIWNEHFSINYETAHLEALTPEGRVTIKLLKLNFSARITLRELRIQTKQYPCE
jgi:hypothetical protein